MVSDGLPCTVPVPQYPAVRPVTPGSSFEFGPFGAVVPSMSSINTYVWTALPVGGNRGLPASGMTAGGAAWRRKSNDGDGSRGKRERRRRRCPASQRVRGGGVRLGMVGLYQGFPNVVTRIEGPDVGGRVRDERRHVDAGAVRVDLIPVDHDQGQGAVGSKIGVRRQ